MMYCKLLIPALFISLTAFGQNILEGGIFDDMTLLASESPYIVTADIALYPGVTLDVEAGTDVLFSAGTTFYVRGTLNLNGVEGNPVVLSANYKGGTPEPWEGIDLETDQGGTIVGTHVIAEYANRFIEFTSTAGAGERINLSNSEIRYCDYAFYGVPGGASYTVTLSSSSVHHVEYGFIYGQNLTVDNCYFAYGEKGVHGWSGPNITITNSEFHDYSIWPFNMQGLIENCHIHHNEVGIRMKPSLEVTECLIAYNEIGIVAEYPNPVPGEIIYGNIICGNYAYDLKHLYNYPINIPNNCWCSDDPEEVEETILHAYDDVSLGIVTFTPFSAGCSNITGLEEGSDSQAVMLYPNPAFDKVYLNTEPKLNYRIYATDGSFIQDGQTSSEIDLSRLAPGVYIVQLQSLTGYDSGIQRIVKL